jgi:hypothetical protein
MKNIIGIVLIALGVFLFVQGLNRKDSLVGAASTVGAEVATSVDGGPHTPKHVLFMVAGGVVAVIGLGTLVRSSRPV